MYHFNGRPPPWVYRSDNYNLTLANMRHPGLLELSLLLWATPTLTLDRLVCSGSLTAFVVLGFHGQCASYVTQQRNKKLRELTAPYRECLPKHVHFKVPLEEKQFLNESTTVVDDNNFTDFYVQRNTRLGLSLK